MVAGHRGASNQTPARIYGLRSTFANEALHAGVAIFTLARVMGTRARMIERHYGTLLDGANATIRRSTRRAARPSHR